MLEELLPVVYANAQEATAMPPQTLAPETEPTAPVPEMPTQTVNGWDYIGYLSIPSLELTLPIQNQWSYEASGWPPAGLPAVPIQRIWSWRPTITLSTSAASAICSPGTPCALRIWTAT